MKWGEAIVTGIGIGIGISIPVVIMLVGVSWNTSQQQAALLTSISSNVTLPEADYLNEAQRSQISIELGEPVILGGKIRIPGTVENPTDMTLQSTFFMVDVVHSGVVLEACRHALDRLFKPSEKLDITVQCTESWNNIDAVDLTAEGRTQFARQVKD